MLPGISIIIPTYREADNIQSLTTALSEIIHHFKHVEVLIVDDDSRDGTKEVIEGLSIAWLKLVTRYEHKDLSLAVIEGLQLAKHDVLLVMDADLSHQPKNIPAMVNALCQPQVDFVMGSRFVNGGRVDCHWPWHRRINAWVAKGLAKRLVNVHDPLSGFFCLSRDTFLKASPLKPIGYKIGLEIMVKAGCQNIVEVPIYFMERHKGKSKLNLTQQLNYLKHLYRLYRFKYRAQYAK